MSDLQDSSRDDELLLMLQEGLPFVPHPMVAVAAQLGMTEAAVVERIQYFFKSGKARRFGAIFDSTRLGYKSALCAVTVAPERMDEIAAAIKPFPSITHCYGREFMPGFAAPGETAPNLWFTVTARKDLFDREISLIGEKVTPLEIHVLPAIRRFKIQVILDPRFVSGADHGHLHASQKQVFLGDASALPEITPKEQEVVRLLQGNLSLTSDPIKEIARVTGSEPREIVQLLVRWKEAGVLRRIALILHHQKIGFKANAMCVWNVPAARVDEVGRCLAGIADITHCYERASVKAFPYNVYAMIHAGDTDSIRSLFSEISTRTGLTGGRVLASAREYKKTSPRFFCEKAE